MHAILIATIAVAGLPVLLHLLLKQEPKRLLFPAVRFLQAKRKTNQRKLRLRHWLLLALRVLLLVLFGLALFQPTLFSSSLNLAAEQPVAAVFILDTSPGMGYTANGQTRLDEARRRALEFLDDLPAGSRVAILDPADPGGNWEVSPADARRKLEDLKQPRGTAVPVTAAVAVAYQLLRTIDQEAEAAEPMPRLVAVFSDRTTSSWDATRTDDLLKIRDAVPPPAVSHVFLDVGVDKPANVGILAVELSPQVIPQNQPVTLTATVAATGPAVPDMTVVCRVTTAAGPEQKKVVDVPAGSPVGVTFILTGLPPGLHQAEIALDRDRPDALPADNIRYLTFRVAEPRKFLTICDVPADAGLWQLAHEAVGEFVCDVKKPSEVAGFGGYEAVCLLNVGDPAGLWPKLQTYVEGGGQLLILPGGATQVFAAYDPATNETAGRLMPAKLKAVIDTKNNGLTWKIDDAATRHPMLGVFREWKLRGNVDVIQNPRRAWKFWDAEKQPDATVVVSYDDPDAAGKPAPAVVERAVGGKGGRVLLVTTRLDREVADLWNNYAETENSSWVYVFPNLLLRYLAGNSADANFNFVTGRPVAVALPKADRKPGAKVTLEGPGVSGRDAFPEVADQQTELRLPPGKTGTAGNFVVRFDAAPAAAGFALNPPADESTLEKVPAEAVEKLFGPGSVVPVGKDRKLRDILTTKFNQPLDLFPWLLILVLLLLAAEPAAAGRLYRGTGRPAISPPPSTLSSAPGVLK